MSVVNKVLNLSKQLFTIDEEIGELEAKKKMIESQIEDTVIATVGKKNTNRKNAKKKNNKANTTQNEKRQILSILSKAKKPLRTCEILKKMNAPKSRKRAIETRIWSMGKDGEIRKLAGEKPGTNVYVR